MTDVNENNDKQLRTMSETGPSNDESISIDELQYLARTIARAENLNRQVEVLIRRTSQVNLKDFKEALLDIHQISSRLVLLAKPALVSKEKSSLID
jgi:hypothetical protein